MQTKSITHLESLWSHLNSKVRSEQQTIEVFSRAIFSNNQLTFQRKVGNGIRLFKVKVNQVLNSSCVDLMKLARSVKIGGPT
jgi:hypothetical protein